MRKNFGFTDCLFPIHTWKVGAGNFKKQISLPESVHRATSDKITSDTWHYVRFFSIFTGTHLLPCLAFYCKTIPILSASLPNCLREEIKASLMESDQKGKGPATNDSVNSFMEKHLRSLTQTLHKKEIVDLLVKLSMAFPQTAKEIRLTARQYLEDHRLVVYGLHEETTTETLCDAFSSSYGEIVEGHVMTDSATGKSRRFGFITFKNIESLQKALEEERTLVDGRLVLNQPANERFDGAVSTADAELRRLYVGSIPRDITTKNLLDFFAKYGEIEEGSVMFDDQERRISKGYGFVTFKTSEDATNAINDPDKMLGSNKLKVKRANKYKPK